MRRAHTNTTSHTGPCHEHTHSRKQGCTGLHCAAHSATSIAPIDVGGDMAAPSLSLHPIGLSAPDGSVCVGGGARGHTILTKCTLAATAHLAATTPPTSLPSFPNVVATTAHGTAHRLTYPTRVHRKENHQSPDEHQWQRLRGVPSASRVARRTGREGRRAQGRTESSTRELKTYNTDASRLPPPQHTAG